MYSLPAFRDYINKLQPPVKEVTMKIRKHLSERATSSEPLRISNYVRYLGLHLYEFGMQYDSCDCLVQLLTKKYCNIKVYLHYKTIFYNKVALVV